MRGLRAGFDDRLPKRTCGPVHAACQVPDPPLARRHNHQRQLPLGPHPTGMDRAIVPARPSWAATGAVTEMHLQAGLLQGGRLGPRFHGRPHESLADQLIGVGSGYDVTIKVR